MASLFYKRDRKLWAVSTVHQGKRKDKYFKTRAEAEAAMASASQPSASFSKAVSQFMSTLKVRESTQQRYAQEIRALSECVVKDTLDQETILKTVENLQRFSEAKAARLFKRFKNLVRFTNLVFPAHLRCSHRPQRGKILPPAVIQQVLETTQKRYPTYYTLVCILLDTGMRLGEALALNWEDFDGKAVQVSKSYREFNKGAKITPTKTISGNRRIVLSAQLNGLLGPLRGSNKAPMFTSPDGYRLRRNNLYKRWWKQVCPGYRIHDIRHTCATFLLGIQDPRKVSAKLGHENATVTLKIYDHYLHQEETVQHSLLHRSA